MNNYEEIINLPHHESSTHQRMSLINRATQFAPFAALNGYEEEIQETARITKQKINIDSGLREIINNKLNIINQNIKFHPAITITYFVKDSSKEGGVYQTATYNIKKIDTYHQLITCTNNTKINFADILNITSDELSLNEELPIDYSSLN